MIRLCLGSAPHPSALVGLAPWGAAIPMCGSIWIVPPAIPELNRARRPDIEADGIGAIMLPHRQASRRRAFDAVSRARFWC